MDIEAFANTRSETGHTNPSHAVVLNLTAKPIFQQNLLVALQITCSNPLLMLNLLDVAYSATWMRAGVVAMVAEIFAQVL